jgi:glycosyltransferase involved in cell wall biosynthesis
VQAIPFSMSESRFLSEHPLCMKGQQAPVMQFLDPDRFVQGPLCTVTVVTFNHAPYIAQCIESVLAQETNFNFELVLSDDGSTDGTREICISYAQKHPERIRVLMHDLKNNIPFLGGRSGIFHRKFVLAEAKGKFVSIFDGDDFWMDEGKLQRDIDYLVSNPHVSMVFQDAITVNDHGQTTDSSKIQRITGRPSLPVIKTLKEFTSSLMPTCTSTFRNITFDLGSPNSYRMVNGDTYWFSQLLLSGEIHFLPGQTAAFRAHAKGAWSSAGFLRRSISQLFLWISIADLPIADASNVKVAYAQFIDRYWKLYFHSVYRFQRKAFPFLFRGAWEAIRIPIRFVLRGVISPVDLMRCWFSMSTKPIEQLAQRLLKGSSKAA